jgi:NTE family protein
MNEFKYNIGYALSGGFIKGFAHLGIMQALHEHGIRPEILSGVSAGALAAVFYADGKEPYHIVELFEHHSFKELTTFSINKQGLLKLDSFIDFLNSNLESKTIEELKIPTIITATDLDHGRIVSFKKGKIAERLAASCCMPILFAPSVLISFKAFVVKSAIFPQPFSSKEPLGLQRRLLFPNKRVNT